MARLFTGDFEETFASEGWTTGGTPTRVTTPVNSGGWSCEIDALGESVDRNHGSNTSEASWYVRIYLYVATRPASGNARLISIHDTGGAELWRCTLTSTGTLQARTSGAVNIGSPSSVLSLNTWYVVETRTLRRAAGVEEIEARMYQAGFSPGASFVNDSTDRGWGSGPGRVVISANEVAATFYVDDVAINDTTTGADNSWPGPLAAPPGQTNAPEKLRVVRSNMRVAS